MSNLDIKRVPPPNVRKFAEYCPNCHKRTKVILSGSERICSVCGTRWSIPPENIPLDIDG
jgi:rRNA maturation endonuclease Nob1